MVKSIKMLVVALLVSMFMMQLTATPALAANKECGFSNLGACAGTGLIFTSNEICTDATSCITFFVNLIFLFAVLATFVVLVWGGLDYIMSGGDSAKAATARGKITNAIVGLVIVILAWAITNLVLGTFSTGTELQDVVPTAGSSIPYTRLEKLS
ncbi:hypothetical protein A3A70_02775 [candidate division WWE3 bacterium RIFCSPLOWO2_01_FULL_42_11]|uniref:Uncharacterized protein n=1 Tax=candidate division WWE3 bacterium RIFCSPLOWO2_01_FULL_42_11 TaxID=1802627 RepID=A0A1F4VLI3_UNCKA|nr:MAG: hypothetical protein A3A70_02775 [candidate division WWE3 bacterium RIFCSPLOWO2_01_FULL_42_11]